MITKFILIFFIGTIETWLFAKWNLKANQQQAISSSIMMMMYMSVYLLILDMIFKDSNSKILILSYVLACGLGNFIAVKYERKNENCKKL